LEFAWHPLVSTGWMGSLQFLMLLAKDRDWRALALSMAPSLVLLLDTPLMVTQLKGRTRHLYTLTRSANDDELWSWGGAQPNLRLGRILAYIWGH